MLRYFVRISYKGTAFSGWQIQENAPSVQAELNRALHTILRAETPTTGCGRTDTGVHASQFYAHFDTIQSIDDPAKVVNSLNAILPDGIVVSEIIPVKENAHARYDATQRYYEYFISNSKNPFLRDYVMFSYTVPNIEKMNIACGLMKECTDFTSFSKSNTQVKTNLCKIDSAYWSVKNDLIVFHISADRFLRGMVRAIVGSMLEIGTGKMEPEAIISILQSKSRTAAGISVPAQGLYLTRVDYPFIRPVETFPFPA